MYGYHPKTLFFTSKFGGTLMCDLKIQADTNAHIFNVISAIVHIQSFIRYV